VTAKFPVPGCNGLGPGTESCYYQIGYNDRLCSPQQPCTRLLIYWGGGNETAQYGKLDPLMEWWAAQGYIVMIGQTFTTSEESGLYPFFEEYARLTWMTNETRSYCQQQNLWSGEYLVIGGVSQGASAPPISIANSMAFRTAPQVWTGNISTAVVLFDGISSSASWEEWLGSFSPKDYPLCWGMHSRAVSRYGDGTPKRHSCRNDMCYCSNPPNAAMWANDTIQLNSLAPPSPYTCKSITPTTGEVYWFISSCSGAKGSSPCEPLGDFVPDYEQSALYDSIKDCDGLSARYVIKQGCGHGRCGTPQCGAQEANDWLRSVWPTA